MIEPYRYADGTTLGEPETPRSASGVPARGGGTSDLALRARLAQRRAATDPQWATRSRESRRRLLDLDAAEQRELPPPRVEGDLP